jgi:hypothetical protein
VSIVVVKDHGYKDRNVNIGSCKVKEGLGYSRRSRGKKYFIGYKTRSYV